MPKAAPKTKTLVESLDALIEKYHLLKHPFYQAWTAGKLSKASLALYAEPPCAPRLRIYFETLPADVREHRYRHR